TIQLGHEAVGIRLGQVRLARVGGIAGEDSPDAPAVVAVDQSLDILLLEVARNRRVIFDYLAIHVHDVQSALRPHYQAYGPEPRVAGSEELFALIRPLGNETSALRLQQTAMDQVLSRLTRKVVAAIGLRKQIGLVDRRGAGGCEQAGVGLGRAV